MAGFLAHDGERRRTGNKQHRCGQECESRGRCHMRRKNFRKSIARYAATVEDAERGKRILLGDETAEQRHQHAPVHAE